MMLQFNSATHACASVLLEILSDKDMITALQYFNFKHSNITD